MFKPFVVIALCCQTPLLLKRPGQFVTCECEEVSVDAGDGFMHRTIGELKNIQYVKNETLSQAFLFQKEIESSVKVLMEFDDLSKFNVDGCQDVYAYLSKQTGLSRQEVKGIFYFYNYTDGLQLSKIHPGAL